MNMLSNIYVIYLPMNLGKNIIDTIDNIASII